MRIGLTGGGATADKVIRQAKQAVRVGQQQFEGFVVVKAFSTRLQKLLAEPLPMFQVVGFVHMQPLRCTNRLITQDFGRSDYTRDNRASNDHSQPQVEFISNRAQLKEH